MSEFRQESAASPKKGSRQAKRASRNREVKQPSGPGAQKYKRSPGEDIGRVFEEEFKHARAREIENARRLSWRQNSTLSRKAYFLTDGSPSVDVTLSSFRRKAVELSEAIATI